MRRGFAHAREAGFAWAICLHRDGQHAAADISRFLECGQTTAATLVVGNRMNAPAAMPWLRRTVNRWMSGSLLRLAGPTLPDTQCGFHLVRLDAWSALDVRAERFAAEEGKLY